MKGDRTLMAVNGIGAALQSLYIAVYCYYSPAKVGGYGAGLWGDRGYGVGGCRVMR